MYLYRNVAGNDFARDVLIEFPASRLLETISVEPRRKLKNHATLVTRSLKSHFRKGGMMRVIPLHRPHRSVDSPMEIVKGSGSKEAQERKRWRAK